MDINQKRLETAQKHLDEWLEAELQLTASQSYTIKGRTMTRADLGEVREQIKFWQGQVGKLTNIVQRGGRSRVYRAVPRDL